VVGRGSPERGGRTPAWWVGGWSDATRRLHLSTVTYLITVTFIDRYISRGWVVGRVCSKHVRQKNRGAARRGVVGRVLSRVGGRTRVQHACSSKKSRRCAPRGGRTRLGLVGGWSDAGAPSRDSREGDLQVLPSGSRESVAIACVSSIAGPWFVN